MIDLHQILRQGFEDYRQFVNPGVAQRAALTREPARVVATTNGLLIDDEGREIEDLHGTQLFGHRHPAITQAVQAFLSSPAPSWFPSRVNPFSGSLARRLCQLTGYSSAFFGNSGSEGVEAALKLARAVTRRPGILGLERAYHGCTMGSCSLMSPGPYRDPFAPHLPGAALLPWDDREALSRSLASGEVAAVVVEPIQLEGGVRPPSPSYLEALAELTLRHGVMLIADEVQTGLGRTGRLLASESWPRRPDAVVLGKGLGGGLQAISAMLTSRELHEQAYGDSLETAEAHNSTFSGHAVAAVAALATLELITPDLLARTQSLGQLFRRDLASALRDCPLFDEVRGQGFVFGVSLRPSDHPWISFEHFGFAELAGRSTSGLLLCSRLYRRGYFGFVCGHDWSTLRLQPRLNIEPERLEHLADSVTLELRALGELA